MPPMHLRSVLLPEPLRPTMPKNSPFSTEKETPRSASRWSTSRLRKGWRTRSLSVWVASCGRRNAFWASTTVTAALLSRDKLTSTDQGIRAARAFS